MKNLLIKNASAVLPGGKKENVSLLVENGRISNLSLENDDFAAARVGAEILDLENLTLCAGFIDIHNHGAVGVDVNGADADGLRKVSEFLATRGVTAWVPTLVPDAEENYRKALEAIDRLMEEQENGEDAPRPAARALGVHYEGVFANEKMCGALRPEFFRTFKNGDEISSLPKLKSKSAVHLTTLAPEVENGVELIKELRRQNWTVSVGHTRADFDTLNRAFAAGARQVTHLFNAMTGVHHREIGVAGWALSNDEVSCEIIADGIHVAPEMLKFALRCKTSDRLVLVSDSVLPAGLGDGEFEIWGEKISVAGGRTRNERGSIAGSVITMLDAFKRYRELGAPDEEISKMASLNPARLVGLGKTHGSIEIGKRADLTVIDEEGNVKLTLVGGKRSFEAPV